MARVKPLLPQRALLTGATGGIGQAIALELASHGVDLLLVGRDPLTLARQCDSLRHSGVKLGWIDADLATSEGRARLLAVAAEWQPDLVIHNAGISHFGWLVEQSEEQLNQQLQLNLLAPMLLDRALIGQLQQLPAAQIIHIGSVFGSLGFAGYGPYCASKFGLRGLVEALRRELADSRITLSYLGPRATATALNSPAVVAMNEALGNRMDQPAQVATALWQMVVRRQPELLLGQPEGLFARLNQLWPRLVDRALRGRLPTIRHFAQAAADGRQPRAEAASIHPRLS